MKSDIKLKKIQESNDKSISESIGLFVEFVESIEKEIATTMISIKDSKGGVTFEVK